MTSPTLISERDAAGAYALLATAAEDPSVIAVLSDEELLALEGLEGAELAGSPFLEASGFDREQAAAVAARSLIARGLVVLDESRQQPEGEDLETGQTVTRAAQLDPTLAGLLTLRGMPLAILNLTRQVEEQATSLMLYVFPQDGILEELVTADGFHHFSLPTRSVVPERLARYVDQAQVAGEEDGESVSGTAAELEADSPIGRRLADTRALTVITSASGEGSSQLSVMATATSVHAMDTPSSPEDRVEVREISAGSLRALLARVLPSASAA